MDGSQKVHRLDLNDLDDASSLGHHADTSGGQRSSPTMSTSRTECTCGAFSDDQKRVVIGYSDGRIVVRNADSGYKFENCFESADRVQYVAISGDGKKVVSASRRDYVRVWDASSENAVGNQLVGNPEETDTKCLAVSFDGNVIVSVSGRGWHRSSEVGTNSDYSNGSSSSDEGRKEDSLGERCSNDGKEDELLHESGSPNEENEDELIEDNSHSDVRVEDELVNESDRSDEGSEDESGGETPSERSVEPLWRYSIRIWDREWGAMMTTPPEVRDDEVSCATRQVRRSSRSKDTQSIKKTVGLSADGHEVVTEVSHDSVRVWSVENADTADGPDRYTEEVRCVAYCGRGSKIVSGCTDGCVRLWDAESGDRIGQPLAAHTKEVECVAVSADANRIESASRDGTVRVWDANSVEAVAEHLAGAGYFGNVAGNDNGKRVVFSFDRWVYVLDVDSGGVTSVTCDAPMDTCVAMSAGGARIAFCPFGTSVLVWDVHAGQHVGSPLEEHTEEVRSLAFSGDGKRLVSGSYHHTVRVWDVASGKAIGHPFVHDCKVLHVQPDVGGAMIASYDGRRYGRLWDVKLGKCVMTSSGPKWTSTLHRLEVARLQWHFREHAPTEIVASTSAEHQQVLASIDGTGRGIAPVGDVYFSTQHGSSFLPFCKLLK
ncbi:Vegetative incompatibility protein HET-E-1 [Gracilariopsis chorda]|uniref:Vegetative incompatibility protein HET-E-1 n=1 Tax=Gracilariopsis chorda TaxID=448386 RepID=A0A2V3IH45_9FLOR|nr:Vegetative incompatibility protein HET-E-1 [Gracilariopsis chorda]|eukprot:PXF41415.1 Vegetative incompatibility protein HET-E-1 [Gracilariopsis chorda]